MAQNTDFAKIAVSQLGNGPSKYRKWFYGYQGYGIPWCAIFVSWCANELGGVLNKIIPKTSGAGNFAREGVSDKSGKWYEGGITPQAGDIVTYCWNGLGRYNGQDAYFSDHVGIVEKVSGGYVYVIEGNTGGTNDTSSVKRKKYAIKNAFINGYYRPYWSSADKTSTSSSTTTKTTTNKKGTASIKEVQKWINDEFGTNCTVDGVFGKQTKSAIVGGLQSYLNKKYNAKLRVDGVFGKVTKSKVKNASKGDKGKYVKVLQSMLICKGYNTGGLDGDFGAKTLKAVNKAQEKYKLTVDGIAGKETFAKLFK